MGKKEPVKMNLKILIIVVLAILILLGIIVGNSIKVLKNSSRNGYVDLATSMKQIEQEKNDKIVESVDNTEKTKNNLSDEELFKKVSVSDKFLALLIDNKNFEKQEFLDEEIPLLLVELNNDIFEDSEDTDAFYVVAKESDIQKNAKKYFGKTINVDKLKDKNGDVKVEVSSGFGARKFNFSKIVALENGNEAAIFNEEDEDSTGALIYSIIFTFDTNNEIIYKGFVNGIPDGIK